MLNDGALAYLASPYTRYRLGPVVAFQDVCKLSARLLIAGVNCYSPIVQTHYIAIHGALDALDHSIWLPFDEAMMAAADVLIVAHLEGWDESFGIEHEIKFFEDAGKPIFDLDPHTLIMARRPDPRIMTEADLLRGPEPLLDHPYAHGKTRSEHGGSSS